MKKAKITKGAVVITARKSNCFFDEYLLVKKKVKDKLYCINRLGERVKVNSDKCHPIIVPNLRVKEEELDAILNGKIIIYHDLQKTWEELEVKFNCYNTNVVKLFTVSGRSIFIELFKVSKIVKDELIKESANGKLIDRKLQIKCLIRQVLFYENT